ncbi:MAG: winged helix-turn-helix transcriptional regulator [FCB group bacterium]|nr:winged helix-turn-helix transcriptional regulator [FCB group bacterium]
MYNLVNTFKALSDSNRLRILKVLEPKPLCVCEITDVLQLAPSTVSKHLSILRDAEFIVSDKEGKWVNYRLNRDHTNEYVRHLLPLIRTWIPDDEQIRIDRETARAIDHQTRCHVYE